MIKKEREREAKMGQTAESPARWNTTAALQLGMGNKKHKRKYSRSTGGTSPAPLRQTLLHNPPGPSGLSGELRSSRLVTA